MKKILTGIVLSLALLGCNPDPDLESAPDAGVTEKGIATSPDNEANVGGADNCPPDMEETGRCTNGGGGSSGGNGPQPGDRCTRPVGQPPAGPYGEVCQLNRDLRCVCWALPAPPVAPTAPKIVRPDCDLWPWDPGCQESGGGSGTGGGGGGGSGTPSHGTGTSGPRYPNCPNPVHVRFPNGQCNYPPGSWCPDPTPIEGEPDRTGCTVDADAWCNCPER
jgi:hypothetical protein